jgi:thiol-disulfide isomerase/thioredoxin
MLSILSGVGCAATPAPQNATTVATSETAHLEASLERALLLKSPATLYHEPNEPREEFDLDGIRFVGADSGPVPEFSVQSQDGTTLDSRDLVGVEPFVVMFFATWCQACEMKMPVLKQVVEELGPVKTILVSVDSAETWPQVPGYLKEQNLHFPVVSALSYPRFFASYNPFQAVPLVVVVGRNGGLVDYQMGFADTHEKRLADAIRQARSIGPLKPTTQTNVPADAGTPAGAKQGPSYSAGE